jgi:hypothetical protein
MNVELFKLALEELRPVPLIDRYAGVHLVTVSTLETAINKYERAVWFLQDIANMGQTKGCETAAHALAQLGERRERRIDPE